MPYLGELVGYELLPGRTRPWRWHDRRRPSCCRRSRHGGMWPHDRQPAPQGRPSPCLQDLAVDVAGWPARAVEFRRLLAFAQPIRLM